MNKDLGLSATAYGVGASVFFIGYLLFEIPSNLLLARVGVRRWLACIMVAWGLASMAMVLVAGETSLYVVRFLLGAAEAGFFPAVIVYLGHWFPREHRGRVTGLFFVAVPLSSVLGAPVSTAILHAVHDVAGLAGWQWVFLLEGGPALLCGIACLWILAERPREATWLAPAQADWLETMLLRDRLEAEAGGTHNVLAAFCNPRVLLLSVILLLAVSGSYGVAFWLPQILKTFLATNMQVGWLTSALYGVSAVATVLWTRHSDATVERVGHIALSSAVGAAGFVLCALTLDRPALATLGLGIACVGTLATLPVFWTIPGTFLTGTALAASIALINSVAQLGGIIVPWFIGWSRDATGGFAVAIGGLGVILLLASAAALGFGTLERTATRPRGTVTRST